MKKFENIKTDWDLTLLYESLSDKQMNIDMEELEQDVAEFRQEYIDRKDYLRRADLLLVALRKKERINNKLYAPKFLRFLWHKFDIEPDNEKIIPLLAKFLERYLEAWNKVEFFRHAIKNIPEKRQKRFLKSKTLVQFRRKLEVTFVETKVSHDLSLGAEEMETTAVMPAYIWWTLLGEELRKRLSIEHNGQQIPFGEAKELLPSFSSLDRIEVNNKLIAQQKSIAVAATFELNAIIGFQKTVDNKRKYMRPFSSALHGDEMHDHAVKRLTTMVTDSFSISHRFYQLHAKLLGLEKLNVCDIHVPIGNVSSFDFRFEKILPVLWQAFKNFDPRCADWFESYLKNGQIDVFPKPGKSPGAYCAYADHKSSPIYIYMNYVDSLNSAVTLAHECGHAFHWELSRHIRIASFRYHSTALAETASTFFEKMMFDRIFKSLSSEDQIVALHARLLNDIECIFRQTALFNYEVELHRLIRKKGAALESEMAGLMAKHLQSYMGPAVAVQNDDGYLYVTRPHLRDFFYHYTYVFGDLVSGELFDRWKKDKNLYTPKIIHLLSAGSNQWVDNLLEHHVGIDINQKDFFKTRIAKISARIDELERLISEQAKK